MNNTIDDGSIPSQLFSRLTTVAILTAQRTGAVVAERFGKQHQIHSKEGRHNLVTEADELGEDVAKKCIKEFFPEHSFLSEESGAEGNDPQAIRWIIDALDGTVNFVHNIPMFSVSIAATFKKEVLCGVIYHPLNNELFVAEKNKGAFLNGQRLHVTSTDVLDNAFIATGFPYNVHENPMHCIELFTAFAKMGTPLRRIGSAALDLAYTAAGRFDAFWEVSLKPWDYAAGKLLVEEAGGKISHFTGQEYEDLIEGPIAASNSLIHDQLLTMLKSVDEQ